MEGTDIFIAMSRSRKFDEPSVIASKWIKQMAEDLTMGEWEVYVDEAVGVKVIEQGVARM